MVFEEIKCSNDDERFMLEAIKEAAKAASEDEVPVGAVMYVTLEPCSMCAGALVLSRISRLVIGADDPKTGACGSLYDIAGDKRLNHRIETERGVLGDICSEQLREFFRNRRKITEEDK